MKKVLLTGGIGSGKSAVADVFRSRGGFVYDSDAAALDLYRTSRTLRKQIREEFGPSVLTPEGVDTQLLASRVFGNPDKLAALETIVHPAVMKDFLKKAKGSELAVMESAIAASKPLFDGFFDIIVYVDAPEAQRLERACRRDGSSPEQVRKRMAAQQPPLRADFVIENDSDLTALQQKAAAVWNDLCELN